MDFGRGPLSHPLLVAALEHQFVPVAIYNNKAGYDEEVLKRFGEPAWNNPVFRFFAPDGEELLPRKDRVWSTAGLAERVVAALEAADRELPDWLRLAAREARAADLREATFRMHCFWEGEAVLGRLDGVVRTLAGWQDGAEVVTVAYLSDVIDEARLRAAAAERGCSAVDPERGERTAAKPSDDKYHLRRSPLRWLPLTGAQATKINADLAAGRAPERWLTPGQRDLAGVVERALRRNAEALEGLVPPVPKDLAGFPPDALVDYERRLRKRLGAPPIP